MARLQRVATMPAAAIGFALFAGANWLVNGTFTLLTPEAGVNGLTVLAMVVGISGLALVLTIQGVVTTTVAWCLGAFGMAGILSALNRPIVEAPVIIPLAIGAYLILTLAALAARWDTRFFWDPNRERRKKTAAPPAN